MDISLIKETNYSWNFVPIKDSLQGFGYYNPEENIIQVQWIQYASKQLMEWSIIFFLYWY